MIPLINDFLTTTYAAMTEAPQTLCIITSTNWSIYENDESEGHGIEILSHGGGPMRVPSRPPWTISFKSPFLNQRAEEVANMLASTQGEAKGLDMRYCVIIDEQTLEDKTVLLVKTWRDEGSKLPKDDDSPIVRCRVSFEDANACVQSFSVGHGSLEELVWNQNA
ncbi:hypothetical protein D6D06_02203 [Aureobasidium pullulans]|nr:hypothetical protein D6D06_02203 [Aureobasidium pullulans]